jgi:hypothetical protein
MSYFVLLNKNGTPLNGRLLDETDARRLAADKGKLLAPVKIGKPEQPRPSAFNRVKTALQHAKVEIRRYKGRFYHSTIVLGRFPLLDAAMLAEPRGELSFTATHVRVTFDEDGNWSLGAATETSWENLTRMRTDLTKLLALLQD